MEYHSNEQRSHNGHSARGFVAGMLLGGLAGAGTMLLLAPHSGKTTRAQIQQKTIELRHQAVETVEDAVSQTRAKVSQIKTGVREQAEELQQRGHELLDEQKQRWSPVVVEAGKKAARSEG
jgi:gas vesicle protein